MKVSDVGPTKAASSARRKKKARAEGSGFADHLRQTAEASRAAESVETPPVTVVDAVLAVQETPLATDERSRGLARRRAEGILSRLDEIRHGLLSGSIPKEQLVDLARTLRGKRPQVDDPRLNEIIEEIELRAEVEIAKLTREV